MGRRSYLHLTTTMEVRATMTRRSGRRPLHVRYPRRPWPLPPKGGAGVPVPVVRQSLDALGRAA